MNIRILGDLAVALLSLALIVLVVLQQRGSGGLGSAFGGGSTTSFFQRRGFERTLYLATWIVAALIIILSLIRIWF